MSSTRARQLTSEPDTFLFEVAPVPLVVGVAIVEVGVSTARGVAKAELCVVGPVTAITWLSCTAV